MRSTDAVVRGRLLVPLVQPDNGADAFLLLLFPTLAATEISREELLQLYGKRWDIELGLRTWKATLMSQKSRYPPFGLRAELTPNPRIHNPLHTIALSCARTVENVNNSKKHFSADGSGGSGGAGVSACHWFGLSHSGHFIKHMQHSEIIRITRPHHPVIIVKWNQSGFNNETH